VSTSPALTRDTLREQLRALGVPELKISAALALDQPVALAPRIARHMNATETMRARELAALRHAGHIKDFWYECFRFKLAKDATYLPDFVILENDGTLRAEEIKGFWREAARVRVKVFAMLYPSFRIQVLKRANGGGWDVEDF